MVRAFALAVALLTVPLATVPAALQSCEVAQLFPNGTSHGAGDDHQGAAIGANGEWLAVGARRGRRTKYSATQNSFARAGVVSLYRRAAGTWECVQWLLSPNLTLSAPNLPPLTNSLGNLDPDGNATTLFSFGPGSTASFAGTVLHHAALVLDPTTFDVELITNPVQVTLVP